MILQMWMSVLEQSFYNMLLGTVSFLPNLLFAVIICVLGWIAGVWLGWVVAEIARVIQVDRALRAAGFGEVVSRAGFNLNAGVFVGALVKWFVILVFLLTSLQVMGLGQVTFFLQQVIVGFLPQVIVAVFIILVAAVVAQVAGGVVTGSARAAGIAGAGVAGTIARWAIWIFAILAALEQLNIAQTILQTLFTGFVVAISIAFGLAFGLGGQDEAKRFLEHTREEMKNHH